MVAIDSVVGFAGGIASAVGQQSRFMRTVSPGRVFREHAHAFLGGLSVCLILSVWEWSFRSQAINPIFISAPSQIALSFYTLAQTELLSDMLSSGRAFLIGFGLAILVGILLGFLVGWFTPVEAVLDPFISFLYATPRVALLPLLVIWVGIGSNSEIAVVFLGALFVIIINTSTGVKNLDAALLKAAHSFGANGAQIFWTIALPGSVPFILSGMRLGLGHALVGIVVGELVGSRSGIGYLMAKGGSTYQTDRVFVGVLIIAIVGILFTALFKRMEDHFQSWMPERM